MKISRRPNEDFIHQFRLTYHDVFTTQCLHISNLASLANGVSNSQPAISGIHSHERTAHALGTSLHGGSSSMRTPTFPVDIENFTDGETVFGNMTNPADLRLPQNCSVSLDDFTLTSPDGSQLPEFTSNVDYRRDSGYETAEENNLNLLLGGPPQPPALKSGNPFLDLETCFEKAQRTPNGLDIVLRVPAGMRNSPTDFPITYLDKGKTYTLQIQHPGSRLCHDETLRLKTDIWVSFENETKNQQAYAHWQRWNQMHERREGSRSGRPGAVECIGTGEQANGSMEEKLGSEGKFLNGFSVLRNLDSAAQPGVFNISVKFNFLSTDFDPFRGTKGEILSLFARNEIVDLTEDSLLDTKAQVHCCRIQLFRENGAQRKSRNNLMRVHRRIKRLEDKISFKQSSGSSRTSHLKKTQIASMVDEMNHLKNMAGSSRGFSKLRPALEDIPSPCFIDDSDFKKDDSG